MIKIYLAGGMNTTWRERIKHDIRFSDRSVVFLDPCDNDTDIPEEYTTIDIHLINTCEIIFAYLELDNPSGIGMAAEIGYGIAKNKTVIFVNEQSDNNYFKFIEVLSTILYKNIEDGIDYLDKLLI